MGNMLTDLQSLFDCQNVSLSLSLFSMFESVGFLKSILACAPEALVLADARPPHSLHVLLLLTLPRQAHHAACCPRLLPPRRPPRHGHPPGPPCGTLRH